jgi:hypothetical protein
MSNGEHLIAEPSDEVCNAVVADQRTGRRRACRLLPGRWVSEADRSTPGICGARGPRSRGRSLWR